MTVILPLLLITYPLVLHLSIYFGPLDLAVYYLAILMSIPFLSALLNRTRPGIWRSMAVGLAFVVIVLEAGNGQHVVKLIPLVVNGGLLWFFASTMVRGRTPLITRFASLMRDSMPPAVLVYTRRATIAWSGYFLIMFILSLLLAIYAPIEMWSFFSNVLSYVLLAVMFLMEFTVRRLFVREHMDYSFKEFLQRLRRVDFRSVISE